MTYRVDKVNSWNGWDPLKQVVLGNCYSPDWFRDVKDISLRNMLQALVRDTQEDLDGIQKTMENLGVDVVRVPENTIENGMNLDDEGLDSWGKFNEYISDNEMDFVKRHWKNGLPKPMITPRDYFIVLGDKFVQTSNHAGVSSLAKRGLINPDIIVGFKEEHREKQWKEDGYPSLGPLRLSKTNKKENIPNWHKDWDFPADHNTFKFNNNPDYMEYAYQTFGFWAPIITRAGDTLIVDQEDYANLGKVILNMFPEFKQTRVAIGGHNDGTFSPVKPGHIVTANWHTDYTETFPNWEVHVVNHPEQMDWRKWVEWEEQKFDSRGGIRWWQEGAEASPEYVAFVEQWMNNWVGFVEETVFEVNMLSISEDTILCLNKNETVHEHLRSIGLDPIHCRFRNRHFWDGGLHCLTVDTVREGGKQNYFQ